LEENHEVRLARAKKPVHLVRGRYIARFADSGGAYYEAPFSQNPLMHFSGGRRGGIYVVRTESGPKLFLYYQQNHVSSTYVHGLGMITMGGNSTFALGDELPADFVSAIASQIL
jgi:hypothetical protein